jgi:hypothetical protein
MEQSVVRMQMSNKLTQSTVDRVEQVFSYESERERSVHLMMMTARSNDQIKVKERERNDEAICLLLWIVKRRANRSTNQKGNGATGHQTANECGTTQKKGKCRVFEGSNFGREQWATKDMAIEREPEVSPRETETTDGSGGDFRCWTVHG